jgi:hypothetical protein
MLNSLTTRARTVCSSLLLAATLTGCSSSPSLAASGIPGGTSGGTQGCFGNSDCPSGLICLNSQCVSPADNKPPEQQTPVAGPPPAATPHDLFTLDPVDGLAIRISAKDLSIEAISVGGQPTTVAAFPGVDRAVVLNPGNAQLQILDATIPGPTQLQNIALTRHPDVLSFSPDGTWAVANTDPNTTPADGEEGVITLARFTAGSGQVHLFDRAAGYRVTNVFFRGAPGAPTQSAVVVSKQDVTFIDLSTGAPPALPPRVALPTSASSDLGARSVLATPDGRFVFIRSFTAPEITAIEVDRQLVQKITLSDIPTDLEAAPSGTSLVAVLRASAKAALFALPSGLADGGSPTLVDLGGFHAGQIAFPPPGDAGVGDFGLLFTNADPSFDLARLDLGTNTVTQYPNAVQKLIQGVGIAPDGRSAVIVHRPDSNPATSDPYDRAVAMDQGYSMFDLASTTSQLRRTNGVPVSAFAFLPQGGWAAVALRDDTNKQYSIDAIDLSTLLIGNVGLASPPDFIGALPPTPGTDPKVWITQAFNGGRVSFLDLSTQGLQTVTGFELNSLIQN